MLRQGKRGLGFNSIDRGDPRRYRGFGAVAWLNALSVTLVASNVSAIADQFGGGNNATQATDANRAAYSASGWNGKPCLDYGSGGTKGYATPSVSLGPHTFIAVVMGNANSGYAIVDGGGGTGGALFGSNLNSSDVRRVGLVSGKQVSATWMRDSVKKQVGRTYNGTHATHLVYVNGLDVAAIDGTSAQNPGSTPRAAVMFIGCNESTASALRGLWVECVIYSSPIPPAIFKRIYNRHRAIWGV